MNVKHRSQVAEKMGNTRMERVSGKTAELKSLIEHLRADMDRVISPPRRLQVVS